MRTILPLTYGWRFVRQASDAAAALREEGTAVSLPHTWNAVDGQDGGNDYHRGSCWYIRELAVPETDGEVYLEIQGAALSASVYLNGAELGSHEGGFSTWRVRLTAALQPHNTLVIRVDNSSSDRIYPQMADFTFYGGLYRAVNLLLVPREHFALDYCGAPGIRVTPTVNLEGKSARVRVETWQNADRVTITVDGQSRTVPSVDGQATAEFLLQDVRLWDGLRDPWLYQATARLASGDEIQTRFGCRHFAVDPERGFFLNGRSYPLRGVCRHQDLEGVGNALTAEDHRRDMRLIQELGANTLRLAHYQHAQEFYDLCDENGLIVWAEIPYITMHMKKGRDNTLSQMHELIVQNYNHPSIAVWGLSNEITAASLVDDDLLENHRLLQDLCRRLDPTRLTTIAHVFMLETDSPLLEIADLNSYNLYYGWYVGEVEETGAFLDAFHSRFPERAIGCSEYGADANPAYQSADPKKGDYTESYQAVYHEHMLRIIEERPWLWATHVWNMFDFAADARDEGGKRGRNQKGLVSFDRRLRKDAFYLYKSAWNPEPMVHICGRRYVERHEQLSEIKVYSNQPEVTLYVDGREYARQSGRRIFRFQLPLTGEHVIEARAAGLSDTIRVRRAAEPNPDYVLPEKKDMANWFDADEVDPDYFSVGDTLGELRRHPETSAVLERLFAAAAASRGEMAAGVIRNPHLQRMLGRRPLISLIQMAGDVKVEHIRQINRILQQVKKP
ncbi:MAG: glycoside hydrolase family 2 TIM barrel-domain containing protein [Bacillota bacterium]|nr:glycoside hydrolase family 2 TIM barrel-domain containing protein [Bacillota bacterium]